MSSTRILPALAVLAVALAACSSGPSRDTAVANLTRGDDALTEEQANCVVDTVGEDSLETYDNFSASYQEEFEAEADNPGPEAQALLDAFIDCAFGDLGESLDELENLGSELEESLSDLGSEADLDQLQASAEAAAADAQQALGDAGVAPSDLEVGTEEIDCSTVEGPCDYGEDPELDALWDACEAGDGQACDDLFFQSPIDSRYEQFGNTCGDRGFEIACADVYSN